VKAEAVLVTLPELFHLSEGQVADVGEAAGQSAEMIQAIQSALVKLATDLLVATTIVAQDGERVQHKGVLIDKTGVVLEQAQLHQCGRHPWVTQLGDTVHAFDTTWGRVGLVVGGDAIYPESFRLQVLNDVEVVAVPTKILEQWEGSLGLPERSAENRMNLVVGSPRHAVWSSMILATDPDFTLWTTWHKRPFDGNINTPIITRTTADAGGTIATIYPASSANRTISQNTNVVENRPWWLADALLGKSA
jgi:predicted amidohydrolase